MNYKFLTYLFTIGATIEFFGGSFFIFSNTQIAIFISFVLFSNSGIHATLVNLFYKMSKEDKRPN